MTARVSHWLWERFAQFADRDAMVYQDQSVSYAQLQTRIEAWRGILDTHGIRPGAVVGLRGDYTPTICALFLALLRNGNVAAPLPATGETPQRYLQFAHADAFIECTHETWSLTRLTPSAPSPLLQHLHDRRAAGLVVFSSGTTGTCKAGLFDVERLLTRYQTLRRGYRTLVFLLLDHLGGMHTLLHTMAHGGTVVISHDRQPEAVCRAIEQHRVELLPTTPTFLRMLVLSRSYERYDLSSLQLITYGTEPMPPKTLQDLTRLFPQVRFKQTYGLSELGVLPTRSEASGSLWLQVGGLGCDTRIVDNRLWIRSETAMLGYLNAPSPFDADGWYNTQDAVEVNGPYIRILGRESDLINVGGQKVYPIEVENVLLEMDNVREATVWGQANPVTGQVVVARVSLERPEAQDALERRVHQFCRQRLAAYKIPVCVDIVEGEHHGQRFKKLRPLTLTGSLHHA
jgi:acyl-CoA synthetase (AMP-forming)/AMP-acid ligase II